MKLHYLLPLLLSFGPPVLESHAQDTLSGKERRHARWLERELARNDPAKWDRMPLWSVGGTIFSGHPAPGIDAEGMVQGDEVTRPEYRVEVARRVKKGWYVMSKVEHNELRSAGLMNAEVTTSWSDGWFGDGSNTYFADIVTVGHSVSTLGLMTGLVNAPFPRRKSVGMTLSCAGGLGIDVVAASTGVERDEVVTVNYGWFEVHHDVVAEWSGRTVFDRQTGFGLSALLDLRTELWLGRSVSIPFTLSFSLPILRPHFSGAVDPESGLDIGPYGLDLTAVQTGTGIVVHF